VFAAWDRRPESKQQPGHDPIATSMSTPTSASIPIAETVPAFVTRDAEGTRLWELTRQFYQKRGSTPAWFDGHSPRGQADQLIRSIGRADREGLDPDLYNVSDLDPRHGDPATLDVRLTYLYLHYAIDLAGETPADSHYLRVAQARETRFDPVASLEEALDQNRVGASLENLIPHHPQYTALRDALAKYKEIAEHGGWPAVPTDIKVKPGQQHAAIPLIARRLAITGDYAGPVNDGDTTYGGDLQEAVKRFQRRHRLEPDAVVGASAIAQMNVPVEERIRQLALNLERWRALPRDLGDRYILVNIPEYRLEVWDRDQVPVTMRVVVGKKDTPTPIFSDTMTHVVFAPYWNVPADIVRKETLPSVMRDPAFLQRTNMEVLDRGGNAIDPSTVDLSDGAGYRFRQRPGGSNSLGLVKFIFPNEFNVYLHDTPAGALFARARRSFSHGCVRVAEPEKLAQYVLAEQPEWTADRIDQAMHSGQEHTVKVARPIPVYLGYWTARVSADGLIQFSDDVYGIDARQAAAAVTSTMARKS
jgi:murein L,D-transpeptidase YcbB/YkuD